MIDLHSHTDESDGSLTPRELVEAAVGAGLHALAITDHDTFIGYEKAVPFADQTALRLIRGIELNTRHLGRNIHLLCYFPHSEPGARFRARLEEITGSRRERNRKLVDRLRSLGVEITLEEVENVGRSLTGRPHFARLLVAKGYASDRDEAFRRYLGESGSAYIERESPSLAEAIELTLDTGGVASMAHPVRLGKLDRNEEERFLADLRDIGLPALEVYHWDHREEDIERYRAIALKYGFRPTGGSDFHGDYKPGVRLGYAAGGSIAIPDSVLEAFGTQP